MIKEGEIQKISRNTIDLRYLILCNDCLIYAKYNGGALGDTASLKVSYKIPLAGLTIEVPNREEYPQDFNIRSPVRSCTLRADNSADRDHWVSTLNKTIQDHLSRRATFSSAASFEDPNSCAKDRERILGESAPVWVPDERVTMCQRCHDDFTLLLRRHHCRACGKVVCYLCSGNKAPLKYRAYEPSRVCDPCYADIRLSKSQKTVRTYEVRPRQKVSVLKDLKTKE